jgi:23S rRNA (guanosine2251-2'-O)-methyltransferase
MIKNGRTAGTEILYGFHPVYEALKAGRRTFQCVYFKTKNSSGRNHKIVALAHSLHIPVKVEDDKPFRALSAGERHQGIAAAVSFYPVVKLDVIINNVMSIERDAFLLLVDSVKDPHNLGAALRTALCVGMHGVIIPKNRAVGPIPAVSKASAGALEHLLLAQVTNMADTIKQLKNNGVWVAGLDRFSDQSIFSASFTHPLAIVIGSEEKGIRMLVKKQCDFLVSIPQKGPLDSLNASVAGAIFMYEVLRQREMHPKR